MSKPIIRLPWWACCGWRSWWCALDVLTRCKVRAICDAHDRRILRDTDEADVSEGQNWPPPATDGNRSARVTWRPTR